MKRGFLLSCLLVAALGMPGAQAQTRRDTLADIRQEMSVLYVELQRLKQELSTTGTNMGGSVQGSQLQRLDALEGEFRRINGKIEELEFRIGKIVRDGTNRIGDLEFRLVELEGGDVSKLGQTTTLGGETLQEPLVIVAPRNDTKTELASGEQEDFNQALEAHDRGDFARAADLFGTFTETYPGGPMTSEAHYWRGESQAAQNKWSAAARSYLQSFSGAPDTPIAPQALYRLGVSLDRIGQREEACLTLNEVILRYPNSDSSHDARAEMDQLNCEI